MMVKMRLLRQVSMLFKRSAICGMVAKQNNNMSALKAFLHGWTVNGYRYFMPDGIDAKVSGVVMIGKGEIVITKAKDRRAKISVA